MQVKLRKILYAALFALLVSSSSGCKLQNNTSRSPECRPSYTVPAKDAGVDYLEFIALGDAGTGSEGQKTVAGAESTNTDCWNNTIYASSQLGFMAFRVSADEIVISVVLADGKTDFCHVIPKS